MVQLTQTPLIVAALKTYNALPSTPSPKSPDEPPLTDPTPSNPITHSQLIDVSRALQSHTTTPTERSRYRLDALLTGASIYAPPRPAPSAEKTNEYRQLMARLRREEEERQYSRMSSLPTASNPFTVASPANPHPTAGTSMSTTSKDEDEMTYADVNRQLTLILNITVTIVACGIALWLISSSWSAPGRLLLSMGGAVGVGVAEVGVYWGYLRRLGEAKRVERGKREERVVVGSWVFEGRRGVEEGGGKEGKDGGGEEVGEEVGLKGPGVGFEREGGGGVRRRVR